MTRATKKRRTSPAAQHVPELADLFRLLGDGTRLRIVLACLQTPVAVSAIAERLELSVSLVSHHLRLLRAMHVVRPTRHGKQVFYVAADQHIRSMIRGMLEHLSEPRVEA